MYPLLKNAPPHDSEEFIDYLRKNNKVVIENGAFIIVENCKYHKPEKPWLTVFFKCLHFPECSCSNGMWGYFLEVYGDWNWLKKSKEKQTVNRFHIHLYK